ncbi:3-deoxy-D-manno-octulosonic acid transferase [Tabrizicola sp. J26]|uniref:3-deoxy-D-manno-octulosonic acid transferase n=1 Tax=Alitabrizicola rongguiensis TaxID=2909234 RepID=UPI001F2BB7B3|nr:glycosyltransferase N-terminal domain-containing protein [Tabrizicola rongguiensis]MCF1709477.1 3-deoxy-D-manno-octulosonic acid transferase [Tabrizicola rongguiensis]
MAESPTGPLLRLYLAATHALGLRAWKHIESRRKRGKEHADRWREKGANQMAPRPEGPLIWMHAVGLGEVLALRGLIEALAEARPDLHFLVTSSARASGEVFDRNRPPRTIHQYLPLDVPVFRKRFLDHWRPDLAVWAEQDLWPGFVVETARRGIPLAMINARMNARSYASRRKARPLYADLYRRFAYIAAQDDATADHLRALAPGLVVAVTRSLKAACAPLADSPDRPVVEAQLTGRRPWCAASTHAEDERVALAVQARRFAADPASLLILAPRLPTRAREIALDCEAHGLTYAFRSEGQLPAPATAVWIADTFGEMGLWYRLCPVSLIGGSFGPVQGHNPWEAVRLGSAVLHGPETANFAADYAQLESAGATRLVTDAATLETALDAADLRDIAARASALQESAAGGIITLSDRLLDLMPR